ncbi:MAG: hypothetical protein SAJ12_18380 [Jaaginema sp. PMC 1079.18]|nr:hypothetical protein [Jaaginema sp. PMC 1080.18]MEC4852953.1 hypothetical protein [Jaaginema sp. PMC 1079.18]MEC4864832.1 hypothetical protein [Jaaginema sp. PMC 1078.18]
MTEEQKSDYQTWETITGQDIVRPPESKVSLTDASQPEVVTITAKISQIITPYFVVLVGLYLYDSNFLIGIILIALGIASLLNFSRQDLQKAIANFLEFIGITKS